MRSSQAAVDLIVANEVGSKAQYTKMYQHPEWPGGASGVTVAIGYDLGYMTREKIASDWGKLLPSAMVVAMQSVAGLRGAAAKEALARVRNLISIPWDSAMHVFENVDLPRYENMVLKGCPGSDKLNGDCFGVITSIVYNRGSGGFYSSDDRFREMQMIKRDIANGNLRDIPDQIRNMKRLWVGKNLPGLLTRRDQEAKLFEAGLRAPSPLPDFLTQPVTQPSNSSGLNVQHDTSLYDPVVEAAQQQLDKMHYHEIGDIDGKFGGKTRGAITAFMNDRGKPTDGILRQDVLDEIKQAVAEGWSRPIAPQRANATAADIAAKVPSVSQTWWQKLWAYVLGLPTAATAVFKFIFGDQATAGDYVEPVKNLIAAIPPEAYLVAVAGVALAIFIQAKRAQDATVAAYREGKIN